MSIELELVKDSMAGDDTGAAELQRARSILDGAIAAEVAATRAAPGPARRRRGVRVGAAGIAAVAACALLVLQLAPSGKTDLPVTAAAQLAHLADIAEPATALAPGQWSTYQMHGVVEAHVYSVGNVPTPDAVATMPLSFQVWSNDVGTTCTSQAFGSASFAGPENSQAWHSLGLVDAPADQPATGCEGGLKAGGAQTQEAIDVSGLSHDPAVLASELQSGTTGIPSLDQAGKGDTPHVAGFLRLAIVLVGPTTGQWPGFGPAMLRTLSLMPGLVSLGNRTAHSGESGPAFTAGDQVTLDPQTGKVDYRWTGPTLILDGQTGALLEASNFDIPVLQSAGQDFVGSPQSPVLTQGVSYAVTSDWIDPVGDPSVVTTDGLPTWIANFHLIEAVTVPNTSEADLSAVIDPLLGNGTSAGQSSGTPTSAETTLDLSTVGSAADVASIVATLDDSHLFASVVVKS